MDSFSGSLSNVGVKVEREQDSGAERNEVSEAEGDSLEDFNRVIAALGKTVGQMNVKCVQDVRFPVGGHPAMMSNKKEFISLCEAFFAENNETDG